jgi:hypothetical protein
MMNHSVRARLFVEKFLQEEGAEADAIFKCTLENAIEGLLTEVAEEVQEVMDAKRPPLVWLKQKELAGVASVITLRAKEAMPLEELAHGEA